MLMTLWLTTLWLKTLWLKTFISGLDFTHDVPREDQMFVFRWWLKNAIKLKLPVQIHGRSRKGSEKSAFRSVLEILRKEDPHQSLQLYWHWWNGTKLELCELLKLYSNDGREVSLSLSILLCTEKLCSEILMFLLQILSMCL